MVQKELDELIREYLTDGVISPKEREVLLRKARQLGLDEDEVDLYIEAQQQKADQANDMAARRLRGRVCPYCGGSIPQFIDKCPHCEKTITPQADEELKEILDKLENALIDYKSGGNSERNKAVVDRYIRKAKAYYGNNPKVKDLLKEIKAESEKEQSKRRRNAFWTYVDNHKIKIGCLGWIAVNFIIAILSIIWLHNGVDADADACIEAVEAAINAGDISKAEEVYNAFIKEHSYRADEVDRAKAMIKRAKVKNGTDLVTIVQKYLEKGDADSAKNAILESEEINQVNYKDYDVYVLKTIKMLLKNNLFDDVEDLAVFYKQRIDDDRHWSETVCYKYLKSEYEAKGRNFSMLEYVTEEQNMNSSTMETIPQTAMEGGE